jgi:hypothetical protein
MELVAVEVAEPHRGEAGLGVIGVDVDDRDVEALGQIAGVAGRPCIRHVGREADLVVGDEVHGATDPVPAQGAEVERLGHHALPGERGVSVDHHGHGHDRIVHRLLAPALGLLRPRAAVDHRSHEFQVTRVVGQRHRDRLAGAGAIGAVGAVVVLHVAGALVRWREAAFDLLAAFEFREDRDVGPADVVGQHVQPAPMGHPHHHFAGAPVGRELDDEVEHGHQHVHALDRKAFLPEVRLVEEPLESLHRDQPVQQREPVFAGSWRAMAHPTRSSAAATPAVRGR